LWSGVLLLSINELTNASALGLRGPGFASRPCHYSTG